ncbi:unnamed protein product [Calypogeia fissa]
MCCCCFPGFCAECCRLLRFACCTRFKRVETKESIVFTAHVPELTVDDIRVQVESGNLMRVIGNRTKNRVETKGSSTRTETSSGQFVKVYKLPENILAEQVRVEVDEDGFVTITVPKG